MKELEFIFFKTNLNYEFYILLCLYIRVLRSVIIVVVRKKERKKEQEERGTPRTYVNSFT